MKRCIFAVAIVVVLTDVTSAQAQYCFGPRIGGGFGYGYGYRSGFAYRGGFGFSYHTRNVRVFGLAGGFSSRSVFVSPIAPVSPFGFGPAFVHPVWGVGPGFGWNPWWGNGWGWWRPPVVIQNPVPVPVIVAGNNFAPNPFNGGVVAAAQQQPIPQPEPDPPGNFLVISPKKDFPPPGQLRPAVGMVAAPPAPPVFNINPFAKPIVVNAEVKNADPMKEAARLLKAGRVAFAAGLYGKAREEFERAAKATPKAAEPHFLQAQAAFAAGQHVDAVVAIQAGLKLDPAWPTRAFDPKEPYGVDVAKYAEHIAELRKVAAANPGNPSLEFLLGYQLWFIGEKVEAKKWFAAVEKSLGAPGPVALFK